MQNAETQLALLVSTTSMKMPSLELGILFLVERVSILYVDVFRLIAIIEIASHRLVPILLNLNTLFVNVINSFVAAGHFMFLRSDSETWNRAGYTTMQRYTQYLGTALSTTASSCPTPPKSPATDDVGDWRRARPSFEL